MKLNHKIVLGLAVAAVLSACSGTPERIEVLESARAMVPQVEASSRAGLAALNVANARKALDAANRLVDIGGKRADVEFEAQNALTHAQIANEKILTAEAQEEIEKGAVRRQAVQLQAREREVESNAREAARHAAEATDANEAAAHSAHRAASLEEELADLKTRKTDRGLVMTLGDVLFDSGQATLRAGAYGTIDRLAMALKDKSERNVLIEGHTDNVGSDANNQSLSARRAESVQAALMQRGVPQAQIAAVGKGEDVPIASNDSSVGRQQNRRVELIFTESATRLATDKG